MLHAWDLAGQVCNWALVTVFVWHLRCWSDVLDHWGARSYITIWGCSRYWVNFFCAPRDKTSLRLGWFLFRSRGLLVKTRVCSTIFTFADNAALLRANCSVSNLGKGLGYVRALRLLNLDLPHIVTIFALAASITAQVVVIPAAIFCRIFREFADNI